MAQISLGLVAVVTLGSARADAGVRLFRPLTADPRENQSHWRMSSYTEDWRYGTDVTDSTSHGGVVQDRTGVAWEVAAGETFRWMPLQSLLGWRGPWVRYQLGVPAGMFSRFDGSGTLINTDYQFGVSLDMLWRGDYADERGITGFRRSVITSRLTIRHRSSHLGDEYIAQGTFGRNQTTPPFQGTQLGHPPVKRMDLSAEEATLVLSLERRNGFWPSSTTRLYAGGEVKIASPEGWGTGGPDPPAMDSPVGRVGLELRTAADAAEPPAGVVTKLLAALTRGPMFDTDWIAAIDLRFARPFNFASSDNPDGETEMWTPHLWTASPYGREFRHYATTWHALVGTTITRADARRDGHGGQRVPAELIVALEWHRGYAVDGQLIDQRQRYRPRGYWVPSVTAHF